MITNTDSRCVTEIEPVTDEIQGVTETSFVCEALQSLERQRRFALKQRIRTENAITAFVACNCCGYHSGIETEKEREELWKKARKVIKDIDDGANDPDSGPVNGEFKRDTGPESADGETTRDTESTSVAGVVRVS